MSPEGLVQSAVPPASGRDVPRAFHRLWSPFWVAFVGFLWWEEIGRQLADPLPAGASVAAALGAAGHLAGNAVEALFYAAFWRAQGIRLRFAPLYEWLVSISLMDLLASALTRIAEAHPGLMASAFEVFVGFGALRGEGASPGSGFRAAFGTAGLLCFARLLATAAVQRRATGRGLGAPLALTITVWLLARLTNWWLVDLLRGMSPLP